MCTNQGSLPGVSCLNDECARFLKPRRLLEAPCWNHGPLNRYTGVPIRECRSGSADPGNRVTIQVPVLKPRNFKTKTVSTAPAQGSTDTWWTEMMTISRFLNQLEATMSRFYIFVPVSDWWFKGRAFYGLHVKVTAGGFAKRLLRVPSLSSTPSTPRGYSHCWRYWGRVGDAGIGTGGA